jgi:hypothetical protein
LAATHIDEINVSWNEPLAGLKAFDFYVDSAPRTTLLQDANITPIGIDIEIAVVQVKHANSWPITN